MLDIRFHPEAKLHQALFTSEKLHFVWAYSLLEEQYADSSSGDDEGTVKKL
jgi:hypothetical protein